MMKREEMADNERETWEKEPTRYFWLWTPKITRHPSTFVTARREMAEDDDDDDDEKEDSHDEEVAKYDTSLRASVEQM